MPLVVPEARSSDCIQIAKGDPHVAFWWATPVELRSAVAARHRSGMFSLHDLVTAQASIDHLLKHNTEIVPSEQIRSLALDLIRRYPLRAADALQLAAALSVFGSGPGSIEFVCLDDRLRDAALAEALIVLP